MKSSLTIITIITLLFAPGLFAQDLASLQEQIATLQSQVDALAEQQNENSSSPEPKTKLGGYGEIHYNNIGDKKELDFHRFVLYAAHEFSDKIRFFSELELEHSIAGDDQPGEIELEQAYIEFDLNRSLQLRTGIMLVPVGILNETHEPETFYGVERNPIEKNIIPATWWSGGFSLKASSDKGFSYDLMVSEGLKTDDTSPFNIRSGRQKTAKADASDPAYTGRIKYTGIPGLELSATARYESNLSQGEISGVGSATLLESHMIYRKKAWTLKALYGKWSINGPGATAAYADKQSGFYIEPSYKLSEKVGVFTRYNEWNTSTLGTELERQFDFGINYWPHPRVVIKADYQRNGDHSNNKISSGFNLGVGYSF